jgi:hypothetical protein
MVSQVRSTRHFWGEDRLETRREPIHLLTALVTLVESFPWHLRSMSISRKSCHVMPLWKRPWFWYHGGMTWYHGIGIMVQGGAP